MKYPRRLAAALLLAGAVLAVGTPGYVARASPNLAAYLLHPALFLGQLVPFLLCAALWLPWRAPAAAAGMTAGVLVASAVAGLVLSIRRRAAQRQGPRPRAA
jgi:hypothetical protein